MTVQPEAPSLWNPEAPTRAEIESARWHQAQEQVDEMIEAEHDAALCDLLRETSALSWLLLAEEASENTGPLVTALYTALVDRRAEELEQEEDER
jgi:hypothetical protein